MAREIRGTSPSGTLYARIMNPSGLWWNGSSFEAYNASNYSDYDIAMTEQGASGVYVADFPTAITSSGTYEYYVHRQAGGSPAEGDVVVNTGSVDWTGSVSASASTGSMTGSDWRDYILNDCGFVRDDKDDELYSATVDAIQEMRRRFMFDEAEAETTTTDTITVDGDFKISLESDFGILQGVILEDGTNATRLIQVSKSQFDKLYPDINVTADRGYPKHFCIYAGSIDIGPCPDSVSYSYRKSYSARAGTITSSTTGVPFTNVYRDILADNVLARLYKMLEDWDKAANYRQSYEEGFMYATRKEIINSGAHLFSQRTQDC